jgi:menaquinone-dependent protoporphyrinogen oxidase
MKTLIIFASKHGATREIAERIAKKLGDTTLHDVKLGKMPTLTDFDAVIIGSPVYAGMINGKIKKLISAKMDQLQDKKVGLFLSGMTRDDKHAQEFFKTNFPPKLLKDAKAQAFLGGVFDPKKTSAPERLVMKMVGKLTAYTSTISDDKIAEFVAAMQK